MHFCALNKHILTMQIKYFRVAKGRSSIILCGVAAWLDDKGGLFQGRNYKAYHGGAKNTKYNKINNNSETFRGQLPSTS